MLNVACIDVLQIVYGKLWIDELLYGSLLTTPDSGDAMTVFFDTNTMVAVDVAWLLLYLFCFLISAALSLNVNSIAQVSFFFFCGTFMFLHCSEGALTSSLMGAAEAMLC